MQFKIIPKFLVVPQFGVFFSTKSHFSYFIFNT